MKQNELERAKELASHRTDNSYTARLTIYVNGDAKTRADFETQIDRLLDEWQLDSETTKTNLTWDDVEIDLTYASGEDVI